MEMLVSWLQSHSACVVYIGLHTLGKEDLLVQLATAMGWKVDVDKERMEVLKLLEMPNVFDLD